MFFYGMIYHIVVALFALCNVDIMSNSWQVTIGMSVTATLLVYSTKAAFENRSASAHQALYYAMFGIATLIALLLDNPNTSHPMMRWVQMLAVFYVIGMTFMQSNVANSLGKNQVELYTMGSIVGLLVALCVSNFLSMVSPSHYWPLVALAAITALQVQTPKSRAMNNLKANTRLKTNQEQCLRSGLSYSAMILTGTWLADDAPNQSTVWIATLATFLIGMALGRVMTSQWHGLLANGLPVALLLVVFLATMNVDHNLDTIYTSVITMGSLLLIVWTLNIRHDSKIDTQALVWSRLLGAFLGMCGSIFAIRLGCSAMTLLLIAFPLIAYVSMRKLLGTAPNDHAITNKDLLIAGSFALYMVVHRTLLPAGQEWILLLSQLQYIAEESFGTAHVWLTNYSMLDMLVRDILPAMFCFMTVQHPTRFALCLTIFVLTFIIVS